MTGQHPHPRKDTNPAKGTRPHGGSVPLKGLPPDTGPRPGQGTAPRGGDPAGEPAESTRAGVGKRAGDAIHGWASTIKARHDDLLRTDPGYGRDLAAGIAALARALLAHPAIVAAITTLAAHLLNARPTGASSTRVTPIARPRSSQRPSTRLWDRDWDTDDWDTDDQRWDDQHWEQ